MPRYILFSGHMIDKPGKTPARFPEAKASAAGEAIRNILQEMLSAADGVPLQGIAAAACGGDILFHEACMDLHIPSEISLALPIPEFRKTSVAFAGPGWEMRYLHLTETLPVHILYPDATATSPDSIWEEANTRMLETALAKSTTPLTLIALWDGQKGDTGGTAHMIDIAYSEQLPTRIIDLRLL